MRRPDLLAVISVGTALACARAARAADAIDDLQPGEWYEVPSSHLADVDPCPAHDCSYSAVEGVSAVIDDWSGGAFDTQRDCLVVWGGGHGGYAGNEVYVFDLATLAWKRVSEPSDPPSADMPYAPDGKPTSRHTYNYVQYLPPPVDRFCSFGGAGFYESGQTGTAHVDAFDFGAAAWETQKFADTLANNLIGAITAFDPMTGHVFQHGGNQSFLIELDPVLNQWTAHGDIFSGSYVDYYKTADVDPVRRKLVAVGNGEVWSWDIGKSGMITGELLQTMGATEIVASSSPGFVYDPKVDRFVAWSGGADVYTLELDTLTWTLAAPAATNQVTPTAPNGNGTFGRFRYSPTRNVFVVVNAVDENVFVYRLSPGGGTPPDGGAGASTGPGGGAAASGATGPGAGGPGSGVGGSGNAGAAASGATPGDDSGCGCRAIGAPLGSASALATALCAVVLGARRRAGRRLVH